MRVLPADTTGISAAIRILQAGGVVAHATETCYGLACDLTHPDAVTKLFNMKHRPLDQPVSALFESFDQAKEYVEWDDEADALAKKYLPGPLTLILPVKKTLPHILYPILNSLGIRISSHPAAMELVKRFGSPLSTTSANLHGQPNPYSVEDILQQFSEQEFQPDLILDSGTLPPNPPSTVIDLTQRDARLLRRGMIDV